MRLLELFSGIGAAGIAAGPLGPVAGAYDQNPHANAAYTYNTGRVPSPKNLATVPASQLEPFAACAWWMSPPCQPYTRRGLGRDADDPRSAALANLVAIAGALRPPVVVLENVPGFAASTMRGRLLAALRDYQVAEAEMCPSALGVPMRRRRYYLVASRLGVPLFEPPQASPRPLAEFLDPEIAAATDYLEEARVRGAGHSAHVVAATDPAAVASCFTSAYARSPVHAGSYLHDGRGTRLFSPEEVIRLLGFPPGWSFPPALPRAQRYTLAGNSLSVDVARVVIAAALRAGLASAS